MKTISKLLTFIFLTIITYINAQCPTHTLVTNTSANQLNDPLGNFSYTLNATSTSTTSQNITSEYNLFELNNQSTTSCNPSYTAIDVLSNNTSAFHSFNLHTGNYVLKNTIYVNNQYCTLRSDTFAVNSYSANGLVNGCMLQWTSGNICYGQGTNIVMLQASICNIASTDSVIATVHYPSPIPTQTVMMNRPNNNDYFTYSFGGIIPQNTLTPGLYNIAITLSTTNGTILNYNNTNDTLLYHFNIIPCGNLQGNVFMDSDQNCNQNNLEQGYSNLPVMAVNSLGQTRNAWTNNVGYYDFYNLPVDTYTIQFNNNGSDGYTVTCNNSLPQVTTLNTNSITTINFAVNCIPDFDFEANGISITGPVMNGLFPGQTSYIRPYIYLNEYCNSSNVLGQIKLVLTPCVTYDMASSGNYTSSILPNIIIPAASGDTVIWNNVTSNGFWNYYDYMVPVITCTNAQVGDTACFTIIVSPINGDSNPINNSITICRPIGVSYDPNNKEVSPAGYTAMGYIPPTTEELSYTINFQNTGSAPAWNIYVLDTLSQNLDVSTLKIKASSHFMQPIMLSDKILKFNFPNIMLQDSTHNEQKSHGYLTYSIKLKSNLSLGTQIKNTGYIYFDYNVPVVTNTAINTLHVATGLEQIQKNNITKVYPNPSNGVLNVNSNGFIIGYKILDITGRELLSSSLLLNHSLFNIIIESLDNGSYILKLETENHQIINEKFIKFADWK